MLNFLVKNHFRQNGNRQYGIFYKPVFKRLPLISHVNFQNIANYSFLFSEMKLKIRNHCLNIAKNYLTWPVLCA